MKPAPWATLSVLFILPNAQHYHCQAMHSSFFGTARKDICIGCMPEIFQYVWLERGILFMKAQAEQLRCRHRGDLRPDMTKQGWI